MKSVAKAVLRLLGKKVLKKYRPDIIGIAGSLGKTTAKEITVHILRERFQVAGSKRNYNTEVGTLLTILQADHPGQSVIGWFGVFVKGVRLLLKRDDRYPELLVLEMGADRPGDIQFITDLAPCTIGVVTAIASAHLEYFKTMKKIVHEKQVFVSHLQKSGFAILNRDDEEVYALRQKTDGDVITFGLHPEADVRGSDFSVRTDTETGWPTGIMFKVTHKGSVVPIYVPGTIGEHIIYPTLAAITVAVASGMHLVEISQTMQSVLLPPGRMRLISGIKGTFIIDDSYNASPEPLRAALQTIAQITPQNQGKRYAVLGDMLEQGRYTVDAHRIAGFRIAEAGIDMLITVGDAMKHAAASAKEGGLSDFQIASFSYADEAGKFLQEKLSKGDVVLVKGSRAMHMEKVVKEIMQEPLRISELLVH
ncbi:MAG TPA: UDP-N-acetylmuramoyl-tripeptide--D-alanyl-D-alanine ligase [Candidatus Kapabacteria bacterium]|nr:UDP-N-acetylmuramoyl-tripeptide--D-alanyl-D-alanine ligase [Candidatus Kapabacteria bacterium]